MSLKRLISHPWVGLMLSDVTQANSASYPMRDGKIMSTGQSVAMLCGWGVKAGMVHSISG